MNPVHKHEPATVPFLIGHLVDMGEALVAACQDLAREPTPERCDQLITRLNGAKEGVRQFRRAVLEREETKW